MAVDAKPPIPEHLSEASRQLWERIVEENAIDAAAYPVLSSLCEAWDRRNQALKAIAESGAVIKDRFGVEKMSPWVAIERDSAQVMHRAFRLLGFDQEPRASEQAKLLFS